MKRAQPHGIGDLVERGLIQPVGGDVADGALDPVVVAIRRGGQLVHGSSPCRCGACPTGCQPAGRPASCAPARLASAAWCRAAEAPPKQQKMTSDLPARTSATAPTALGAASSGGKP